MKQLLTTIIAVCASLITGAAMAQEKKPVPPKVNLENYAPPVALVDFLKNNPGVESVEWKTGSKISLKLKSGKTESYDLSTHERQKLFRKKYGAVPLIPAK